MLVNTLRTAVRSFNLSYGPVYRVSCFTMIDEQGKPIATRRWVTWGYIVAKNKAEALHSGIGRDGIGTGCGKFKAERVSDNDVRAEKYSGEALVCT